MNEQINEPCKEINFLLLEMEHDVVEYFCHKVALDYQIYKHQFFIYVILMGGCITFMKY